MGLAPTPGVGKRAEETAALQETPTTPEVSIDGGETFFAAVDLSEIDSDTAIEIEDQFGITWLDFLHGLTGGSAKAQKILVWLAMRRDNPELRPDDVKYDMFKFETRAVPVPLSEGTESVS